MSEPTPNIVWSRPALSRVERWAALNCRGCTLWFTGLSGSGKSTIAVALEAELLRRGRMAYRLDGDNIRHGLNAGLGFSAADRHENIRRIGEVARLFADAGVITLVSFISPYRADRAAVRAIHASSPSQREGAGGAGQTSAGASPTVPLSFLEVFVDTPLEECEKRDPKGLYKKARAGQITGFTGIDDPYEPPLDAEIVLRTRDTTVEKCVSQCVSALLAHRVIEPK